MKQQLSIIATGAILLSTISRAEAATLENATTLQTSARAGTFIGARLRLSVGGNAKVKAERLRAGLAIAPIRSGHRSDGAIKTAFGPGLEFGFAGHRPVGFSIADRPVSEAIGRDKAGISTSGKVAIGVGAALIVYLGIVFIQAQDALNDPDR